MIEPLIGAVVSGVLAFVFLFISIVIICCVCPSCYRCRRQDRYYKEEETNGYVPNGTIPTITQGQIIPIQGGENIKSITAIQAPGHYRKNPQVISASVSAQSKNVAFPSMPVRHISTYSPRYLEDINPLGPAKPNTYSGPYSHLKGYDIRQHTAYRGQRSPLWNHKIVEEVATMELGNESPETEHKDIYAEIKRKPSKEVKDFKFVEKSGEDTDEGRSLSHDSRPNFAIITDLEPGSPVHILNQPENGVVVQGTQETVIVKEVTLTEAEEAQRRQRRHQEGELPHGYIPPVEFRIGQVRKNLDKPVAKHFSPRRAQTNQDPAVYFTYDGAVGSSNASIPHYFATDNSLLTQTPSPVEVDEGEPYSWVRDPNDEGKSERSFSSRRAHGISVLPPPNREADDALKKEVDYRVIKSKRRPSWLKGRGFKLFRAKQKD